MPVGCRCRNNIIITHFLFISLHLPRFICVAFQLCHAFAIAAAPPPSPRRRRRPLHSAESAPTVSLGLVLGSLGLRYPSYAAAAAVACHSKRIGFTSCCLPKPDRLTGCDSVARCPLSESLHTGLAILATPMRHCPRLCLSLREKQACFHLYAAAG